MKILLSSLLLLSALAGCVSKQKKTISLPVGLHDHIFDSAVYYGYDTISKKWKYLGLHYPGNPLCDSIEKDNGDGIWNQVDTIKDTSSQWRNGTGYMQDSFKVSSGAISPPPYPKKHHSKPLAGSISQDTAPPGYVWIFNGNHFILCPKLHEMTAEDLDQWQKEHPDQKLLFSSKDSGMTINILDQEAHMRNGEIYHDTSIQGDIIFDLPGSSFGFSCDTSMNKFHYDSTKKLK